MHNIPPTEGRGNRKYSSNDLVGVDGNAFSILAAVKRMLRKDGASKEFIDQYMADAMSGDYDNLFNVSMEYLDS